LLSKDDNKAQQNATKCNCDFHAALRCNSHHPVITDPTATTMPEEQ
jgi:hypothetical protein